METHPITEWRKRNGIRQGDFAASISVSRWTVNRIECGERFPGRVTISRIIEATNGEIDAAQLIGLPQSTSPG